RRLLAPRRHVCRSAPVPAADAAHPDGAVDGRDRGGNRARRRARGGGRRRLTGPAASAAGEHLGAPLDGAEPRVAEGVGGEADGLDPLVAIARTLHARVAGREQILHTDPVRAPDSYGESEVHAVDDLATDVAGADPAARALAGHEVCAVRRVHHESFTEDRAKPELHLGNDPVVVVALLLVAYGAGRAEPDAAEERALYPDSPPDP